MVVGEIHDATVSTKSGYFWTEIFFVVVAAIGLVIGFRIKELDKENRDVLDAKP